VDGFVDEDGDGYDDALMKTPLTPEDSDDDGIPDYQDKDDLDNDGIPDSIDEDDDNDGIPDTLEGNGKVDSDKDGVPDHHDLDTDNDGILDVLESGADGELLDADGDGRIDAVFPVGNNGLADAVETATDSGLIVYNGGKLLDTDTDGVPDFRDCDSDNDGIFDVVESGGSDPDNNGLVGTGDPAVNADGVAAIGTIIDTDGDGVPDHHDRDSDNDGIPDTIEAGISDPDLDAVIASGVPTVNNHGVAPGSGLTPPDTDGDGIPDQLDLDSDNDGVYDLVEEGGIDSDDDGMVDDFKDYDSNGFDDDLVYNPLSGLTPDTNIAVIETGLNGAGCSVTRQAPLDPTFPLFVCFAFFYLVVRRTTQLQHKE